MFNFIESGLGLRSIVGTHLNSYGCYHSHLRFVVFVFFITLRPRYPTAGYQNLKKRPDTESDSVSGQSLYPAKTKWADTET
jgi:hypothetical protein